MNKEQIKDIRDQMRTGFEGWRKNPKKTCTIIARLDIKYLIYHF